LGEEGGNSFLIKYLLNDAQQWNWLSKRLRLHISESEKVLRDFRESEVLLGEVRDFEGENSSTQRNAEELKAIRQLSEKINELNKSCSERIRELGRRTGEMIELVSISRTIDRFRLRDVSSGK
jgi:hypothetical protein